MNTTYRIPHGLIRRVLAVADEATVEVFRLHRAVNAFGDGAGVTRGYVRLARGRIVEADASAMWLGVDHLHLDAFGGGYDIGEVDLPDGPAIEPVPMPYHSVPLTERADRRARNRAAWEAWLAARE